MSSVKNTLEEPLALGSLPYRSPRSDFLLLYLLYAYSYADSQTHGNAAVAELLEWDDNIIEKKLILFVLGLVFCCCCLLFFFCFF